MPRGITDPNDPDFLTDEELALLESGDDSSETPPAAEAKTETAPETPAPEEKPAKVKPPVDDDRSLSNLRGEITRRKANEAALKEQNDKYERELAELRAEAAARKAREKIDEEAQERVRQAREEAERPDPEVDPFGAKMWDLEQKQKKLDEFFAAQDKQKQEEEALREQRTALETELKSLDSFLLEDVTAFKAEHPDYDHAAQKVIAAQRKVFQNAGYTEDEAGAMTANMLLQMARKAKVQGKSVAESVYNVAVEDLGYTAKGVSASSNEGENRATENETPPEQPEKPTVAKVTADAKAKIAALKKAQQVQGLGGQTPNQRTRTEDVSQLSPEEIANMSDEDFLMMKQDPKTRHLLNSRMEELG